MGAWVAPVDVGRQTGERRQKQKTGRNCLGPVTDFKAVVAEPVGSPVYNRYMTGRMPAGLSTIGRCSQMSLPALHFSKI